MIALMVMLMCGSSNDFLGKTIYQLLSGDDEGLRGLSHNMWMSVFLTGGSFFFCSFALIKGRVGFSQVDNWRDYARMSVPAVMDLFVTGGRYIGMYVWLRVSHHALTPTLIYTGLVFLPAAVVSIMKNGLQLVFLAIIKRFYRNKKLKTKQWVGLSIVSCGLVLVSLNDLLHAKGGSNAQQNSLLGVSLMVFVAFAGAVRNTVEEALLTELNLNSDFLVGVESIVSFLSLVHTAYDTLRVCSACVHSGLHHSSDTDAAAQV